MIEDVLCAAPSTPFVPAAPERPAATCPARKPPLILVDVETTTLDPEHGAILELAMIAVDPDSLEIIDTFTALSPRRDALDALAEASPVVRSMHDGSGLLLSLTLRPASTQADGYGPMVAAAVRWLRRHVQAGQPPMCGNSVHFDRRWLERHTPELAAWFHRRNIDVSSLRELWAAWGLEPFRKPSVAHRALSDLFDCVQELRHYRRRIQGP